MEDIERKIFDTSGAFELVPVMPMIMRRDLPFDREKYVFDIREMIRNIGLMVMSGQYSNDDVVRCINAWGTNYIEKCKVKKYEDAGDVIYVTVSIKGRNSLEWSDVDFEMEKEYEN